MTAAPRSSRSPPRVSIRRATPASASSSGASRRRPGTARAMSVAYVEELRRKADVSKNPKAFE